MVNMAFLLRIIARSDHATSVKQTHIGIVLNMTFRVNTVMHYTALLHAVLHFWQCATLNVFRMLVLCNNSGKNLSAFSDLVGNLGY